MKNNNIKNRFLSTTLTVLVAGVMITTTTILPVHAADNTTSKATTTISSLLSKAKDILSSSQPLIDEATKSVNSLLNNKDVTKSAIDKAQSLLNKIPNNDQTKNTKNKLQSSIDKANNFLNDKSKVDETTDNLNKFLKDPVGQSKTAAKNNIQKAKDLINKLPDNDQYKDLKSRLQTAVDKAENSLNK